MLLSKMRSRVLNKQVFPSVIQNVYWNETRYLASATTQTQESQSQQNVKPYKSIPGLSSLPLIGTLHNFLPFIGTISPTTNLVELLQIMHKKFGPIVKMDGLFGKPDTVILYQPEDYERVFRSEEVSPLRPSFESISYYRTELMKEKFKGAYGLTPVQGEIWRDFRTKVNPALLKPKSIKIHTQGLEEIAKEMVTRLTALSPDYLQENFDVEVKKFALECVGLIGLDARIRCMQDDVTSETKKLFQSIENVVEIGFKMEINPIKLWKYFSTPEFKKLTEALETQWEISTKYIKEAKQRINERVHETPEEEKSIVEKLLAIDEKVAVMMANEMLLAGIDTVTFSSIALMYNLAQNQTVQDKLRKECYSGEHRRRYLRACLRETLRINPVVALNIRQTTKSHVVAGYHIPEGIAVVAPHEYLSKTAKYYPRPTEFLPERWLADKNDPLYYGNTHPMVTLPFGFGVRMCIAKRIAELEIETLIHTLVKDYVIKWDGPPLKVVTKINKQFEKPYHFKFEAIK